MYGNLRRTRDQAHANFARNESKRAAMKAAFAEIGATTLEQMNAVAPEMVAHIMSEAGYTADDLTSDGVAFSEVRERDGEAEVKARNAQGAQDNRMVAALPKGLQETISNRAAVVSALDGVDANFAIFAEEQRVLRELGAGEKPKSLDALPVTDKRAWQAVFDAANAQPAPPVPADHVSTWSPEKCAAWLDHEAATKHAAAAAEELPSVTQMRRENEADDARRAKEEKPADDFAKFFPQGS